MGLINIDDVDNYSSAQGTSFFKLENDKDVATVRFCHKDAGDVQIAPCHQITVNGKQRKILCLRKYNEPVSNCPLCAQGYPLDVRFFVSLLEYKKDSKGNFTGEVEKKIWERGRTFKKELIGLSARYNPLWKTVFEIERQGAKGESTTKYGLYPMNYSLDELNIEDFDLENESVVGNIVMDKTFEEMEYFVNNNEFPATSNNVKSTTQEVNDTPFKEEPVAASRREIQPTPRNEAPTGMGGMRRRI